MEDGMRYKTCVNCTCLSALSICFIHSKRIGDPAKHSCANFTHGTDRIALFFKTCLWLPADNTMWLLPAYSGFVHVEDGIKRLN